MRVLLPVLLSAVGCAHKPLAGADLDRVVTPAFISRIEEGAGPRSEVFRSDSAYGPKLKRLEPKEADRRLTVKLQKAMNRFEIAERLRATTVALLPPERPWTRAVDPAQVANKLQSFLVEEVPANPPDYNLMRELGADTVVEFVIEEYGIRSTDGGAQAYMLGYGRMFQLGGPEVWRRNFKVDLLEAPGFQKLDPFQVAKDPALWRDAMYTMLDAVAQQFAKDLSPADRRGGPALPAGSEELQEGGDSVAPQKETDVPEGLEDPL